MNENLASWFDAGKATEALLGGGAFFIPESTYRDRHDRILVCDQLLLWAADRGRGSDAAQAFLAALDTAVADLDAWGAYDLVWSYLIVRRDHHADLNLGPEELLPPLDEIDTQLEQAPEFVVAIRVQVREGLAE